MLKLIIDRQEVVTPADFSAEYHITNPYFTREGEHTYDIDIDITNPVNAKVYGHINRHDVASWPKNRSALIVTEQGTVMRGTEVILEMTNATVKIQLVGGTSELNYLSGKNMMLQDLGIAAPHPNASEALASLSGSYPGWEYVCTPFCVVNETEHKDYEFIDNETMEFNSPPWVIMNLPNLTWSQGESGFNDAELSLTHIYPLYYLAAYIDKIFRIFGYTIAENAIADDAVWKKVIMMRVPRWTVSHFIEEVEKFFNVVFDVDCLSKTVNIRNTAEFFSADEYETIPSKDVIAPIQKKYDAEGIEDNRFVYENVRFNLDNSLENNYRCLPDEVREVCEVVNVTESSETGYYQRCFGNIWKTIIGNDWKTSTGVPDEVARKYGAFILYTAKIQNQNQKFLIRSAEEDMVTMRLCDELAPVISDNKNELELNIIPTEMISSYIQFDHSPGNDKALQYPMPIVKGKEKTVTAQIGQRTNSALCDLISNGPTETDDSEDKVLPVAFYFGKRPCNWESENSGAAYISLPVASPFNEVMIVRKRIQSLPRLFWENSKLANLGNYTLDMSLTGDYGLYNTRYSHNDTIDTTQQIILTFRTKKILDARKKFVINNQKYFCQELKYTLIGKGLSEVVEGTFYPIQKTVGISAYDISVTVNIKRGYISVKSSKILEYPIELTLTMTSTSSTMQIVINMNALTQSTQIFNSGIYNHSEFSTVLSHHEADDAATYNIVTSVSYSGAGRR